ncbi:MAG: TIGR03915 family putative DNA repair protein [Clostridiales Family XIII bacterium]|jgi:probable DNA metabolism protein|nr:TIGR03915 family putative DNA repair protein [Clostridiales Family XIII bacterium]
MIYLYDGTFDGFLTCVYEHYYAEKADGIHPPGAYQPDLLVASRAVDTDEEKAGKVEAAIRDKISPHALARVYRVFRTSVDEKEMLLLNYIRFCFKGGLGATFLHTHPAVLPIDAAELKIGNEAHRLCGLIRFSAVAAADDMVSESSIAPAHRNGQREILYAQVSPDHEVLEFIAPHFADRFKNDPFIIHDTKRGKAVIAWQKRWHIADFTERDAALLTNTASEEAYRNMWRGYFDTLAIRERTNPRCQRNLMPARYWRYLPEMQLR